jgi:hypothetical protein
VEFNYSYKGSSAVTSHSSQTKMSFSPDTKREPTYFVGELQKNIEFREAISALHNVVVSDLRFKPKDKTAYKQWAAERDKIDVQILAAQRGDVVEQIKGLQTELNQLYQQHTARHAEFNQAKQRFFNYLYEKERDVWFVLDPVITIHPDEVFFECFSQDESTYGRLGTSYEVFKNISEFSCGTTNIDYSAALYNEFQKIRSYKTTRFEVEPSGFEVKTEGEEDYKEVKIDLPDSWVRGFLQVSSAMSLPTTSFTLHPMDVYNICFVLRRHKENLGPRSLRYILKPGEPIKLVFDPWDIEVVCPRSIYQGTTATTIRVWGRRRILILERLIPIAKSFSVHLLGTGLPSFYVADLGHMSFTLGLSGWTANDWSTAGNFDLMAPRAEVDSFTKRRIFDALKEKWVEKPDDLSKRLGIDLNVILGALSAYTQAGRAIYDLNKSVYRVRELSRDPLPMDKLRFANAREESATSFLSQNAVKINVVEQDPTGTLNILGNVKDKSKNYNTMVGIDKDERIAKATCECYWHQQNKLFKGPCEHILALRMQHSRQKR